MKSIYTYNQLLKEIEKLIRRKCCCIDVCETIQGFELSEDALVEGDLLPVVTDGICVLKPYDATGEIEVCTILQGLDDGGTFDRGTDKIVTIRDDGTPSCELTDLPTLCEELQALPNNSGAGDLSIVEIPFIRDTGEGLVCEKLPLNTLIATEGIVCGGLVGIAETVENYDPDTDVIIGVRSDGETNSCIGITLPSFGYTVVPLTFADSPYLVLPTSGEHIYLADATGGDPLIINLPTAVGNTAKYTFKKIDASANTINVVGTETMDGFLTQTILFQYTAFTIISDGAVWHIIA